MAVELFQDPDALKHLTAYDRDDRLIGDVAQVYVDDASRHPDWVTVETDPYGTEHTFVPLAGAVYEPDGILRLAYSLETVTAAPRINADQHLDLDQDQELYAHYGLTPPQGEASGAPGVGDDRPQVPLTGAESEVAEVAELSDGPPAERPHLHKFVPAGSHQAPEPVAEDKHR
ncbi:hypothetical protein [Actinacidiphila sp. ITFR-21]|uniref:hypothetical protein n=1 Tax=Actinacidiphila sp. ITFR-21 TaxID=3075199 RepID=UPI00288A4989|nr:hypothetical protein [Streptomyces sp. ITFR-21]WNI14364.1 hypothetical protein RLT57_01640 [Streptomyces sp. ITFR-21]